MLQSLILKALLLIVFCFEICHGKNTGRRSQPAKKALGRDYRGNANTTIDGIPCQRWTDVDSHFTDVGDHNYCRNPEGSSASQVWCYTLDPETRNKIARFHSAIL